MPAIGHVMGHFLDQALGGNGAAINWLSDTINVMLSTNPPVQAAWLSKNDVTGEVSGTGYTAGGQALTSKTVTYTDANVPAASWAASTAYSVGQVVQGTGTGAGYIFKCTTAGTSGATAPTFNTTLYGTTTDNTVTWTCVGRIAPAWAASTAYAVNDLIRDSAGHLFRCAVAGTSGTAAPAFSTSYLGALTTDNTVTWEYVGYGALSLGAANVSWANSTITAAYAYLYDNTNTKLPLIGYVDFGGSQSSSNGTFAINWDPHGIFIDTLS